MPTYEYECLDCGHHFEMFQSMTAEPLNSCLKCYKPVRRLIGAGSGIIFKGPGFYATDYRKTKPAPASEEKKAQKICPENKESNSKKTSEPKDTKCSSNHG